MSTYNMILSSNESTVVAEYEPQVKRSDSYQSEAALEQAFIKTAGGTGLRIRYYSQRRCSDRQSPHAVGAAQSV